MIHKNHSSGVQNYILLTVMIIPDKTLKFQIITILVYWKSSAAELNSLWLKSILGVRKKQLHFFLIFHFLSEVGIRNRLLSKL